MNAPQKYDPVIHFVDSRLASIKRIPIADELDRAAVVELIGIKAFCQLLNQQEALVAGATAQFEQRIGRAA